MVEGTQYNAGEPESWQTETLDGMRVAIGLVE